MKSAIKPADVESLINLVHHRWNIPIIAELHRNTGAKFITLANRLSVSRASLSASLEHLVQMELVERNTGYGHPMRPEYLLTKKGAAIGPGCLSLIQLIGRRREGDVAFRKWTLPLVAVIGLDSMRFNELRSVLDDASPRAITLGLKSLLQRRWAARRIIDDFPPAAGYTLRPRGRQVLARIGNLC